MTPTTDTTAPTALDRAVMEHNAKYGDHTDLRTLISSCLHDLDRLLPLANALVDTRQRGIGFLSVEARMVMDDLVRKERRDQLDNLKAGIKLTGATPAPGSISAYSILEEAQRDLDDLAEWLNHRMRTVGVCLVRDLSHAGFGYEDAHIARLAQYVAETTSVQLLRHAHVTLEDITTRTRNMVDGRDIKAHPEPCPFCGRRTLVVYLTRPWEHAGATGEGVIRCERDPKTGQYEDCVCNDSYCPCKTAARHRHEWRNGQKGKWGWYGLRDDLNYAKRTNQEKEPTR